MNLPDSLMNSLTDVKGFDKEAFKLVHCSIEQVTSVRINPLKVPPQLPIDGHQRIPWTKYGYYLDERPSFTFDPIFHAGCYYVQEASSMFLEQALSQTTDLSQPLKVLDLCGAPGGKSTHIQSLLSPESILVSNDVIRSRAAVLKDNIIKWGCQNVVVTNNDPKDFAELKGYFDVIVIDAPCSGSGLFRRDPDTIAAWSINNVNHCSQRQQRILADIWPALKEDGVLIYSTCSFSKEEDEEIADWMLESLRHEARATSLRLKVPAEWKITELRTALGAWGYRFWPDKVKGEGFFIACFRKSGYADEIVMKARNKPEPVSRKEREIIDNWVESEGLQFIKHENTVYAWPDMFVDDFTGLLNYSRVIYSGTIIGELLRDKLVPDHALALSGKVNSHIDRVPVDLEQGIRYLQRKDLTIDTNKKGWQLVSYEGQVLGWINVLPNRINNYYPKEMRILKDN